MELLPYYWNYDYYYRDGDNYKEGTHMNSFLQFINGFKEGQKEFGETIGIIVNSVLLTIVYFVGVGFTFVVSRIFKKRFLDVKLFRDNKTYWSDLNLRKKNINEHYRQF